MKYFLATTLFLALGSLDAQAPPKPASPDDGPAARITLDVTRVNMLFTVSDKKGRFVTDLNKEEFEILEANQRKVLRLRARRIAASSSVS